MLAIDLFQDVYFIVQKKLAIDLYQDVYFITQKNQYLV